MGQILSLKFFYDDKEYYSLLRVKEKENSKEYYITVMNGELESRLYGNHIIKETEGLLSVELPEDDEAAKIKVQIGDELSKYLNKKMVIFCKVPA
jgi:hypothetical protein